MNDCNHAQCRQVHQLLDALLEMMKLPPMEGIVSVGKAVVVCQEIGRLQSELTNLKTPHRCFDCEHFDPLYRHCYGQTGVRIEACKVMWICGHFKAKGQQ